MAARKKKAEPATTANMYADISLEDMQNGLNGLYEKQTKISKK
jgi:hypothetical protein